MASSQLKHIRTTVDKFSVNGYLNADGETILYQDENKDEQSINILDCLSSFKEKDINFSISVKKDEDLGINFEE